jgi:c-di-AMP phosphodiesterase-like protein
MDNKYNYFNAGNRAYMIILAFTIVVLFVYGHLFEGAAALFVYAILVVYNIRRSKVKKDEWKKFVEDFSSQLDIATRSTLIKLPFPLMIVGDKGNIVWYNQNTSTMLEGKDLIGTNINEVVKEFNIKQVLNEKKSEFRQISF